jgi:hypothetical protein
MSWRFLPSGYLDIESLTIYCDFGCSTLWPQPGSISEPFLFLASIQFPSPISIHLLHLRIWGIRMLIPYAISQIFLAFLICIQSVPHKLLKYFMRVFIPGSVPCCETKYGNFRWSETEAHFSGETLRRVLIGHISRLFAIS